MISVSDLSLNYGSKVLFEKVNLKFRPGNTYGLIGANGAGKSTFLKILSGEIDEYIGQVEIPSKLRVSVLRQDHHAFDEQTVIDTVIAGNTSLAEAIRERDAIYEKPDFSDEDGMRAADLEERIEELGGYEAESDAAKLLAGLGITEDQFQKKMGELTEAEKVKVLLAQALFGNPDILLLDEPTNGLDLRAVKWLEDFLIDFDKTVVVVSHDRHFLNSVCTHMADIDYGKITLFVGNYDFWFESSQLIRKMQRDQKRRAEEKAKELKDFIARFSANASKSKQATSRKKALEKLNIEEMKASTRKFPYVDFKPDREPGDRILNTHQLTIAGGGIRELDLELGRTDKVVFLGDPLAVSALFDTLAGEKPPESGTFEWGVTTSLAYFPADHSSYFEGSDLNLIDWLRQYSKDQDESYIRSFLGRMLFSGEEATKKVSVLSGGEKVRMMLSKLMLSGANVLILDNPTSHLDLESIQTLNNALQKFPGVVLFASHDHQFISTIANRTFEVREGSLVEIREGFDAYMGLV